MSQRRKRSRFFRRKKGGALLQYVHRVSRVLADADPDLADDLRQEGLLALCLEGGAQFRGAASLHLRQVARTAMIRSRHRHLQGLPSPGSTHWSGWVIVGRRRGPQ